MTALGYVLPHLRDDLLRAMIEHAPSGLLIVDSGQRLLLVNRCIEEMFGYSADDLVGQDLELLIPLRLRSVHREQVEQMHALGGSRAMGANRELVGLRSDGTEIPIEVGLSTVDGELGRCTMAFVIDISARRRAEAESEARRVAHLKLEAQMRAAQRMESIGRLAGGVAHDFNNLLTVIQSYGSFVREQFRPEDPAHADVQMILDAATRATKLTSQLLAFSRRQVQELRVVKLNDIVAEIETMLRRLIGEDIALVTALEPSLRPVEVDPSFMEQVLVNLAVNARDAMPRGGRLTIGTSNVEIDESSRLGQHGFDVPAGHYVKLAVTDTGNGIDPAIQQSIFEPFFTTKSKDKGTGLGLSTVFGIVKQSAGYIWVDSEPGHGATFEVYLPAVAGAAGRLPGPDRPPASVRGGAETILVVEDERMVRKAVCRILSGHGYRVLEAGHGGDALLLAETHPGAIDLMLSDIIMPGIGGKELSTRVLAHHPAMKVIFMSGYSDESIVDRGVLAPGTHFLQKPFPSQTVLTKVREVLDQEEAGVTP
jgi:hypothetical protein